MKCPVCNSEMIWQSDCELDELGFEEKGVASLYICSNDKCESDFTHVQKEKSEE